MLITENNIIIEDEEICDPYSNISCRDALESFYKLKGFFNKFAPEHLSHVLNIEDYHDLGMEPLKKIF